jgi:dUTP pyrophosphatase
MIGGLFSGRAMPGVFGAGAMPVRVKRLHKDAVIPTYSKKSDAGLDLTAISVDYSAPDYIEYGTGLAIEIPEGFVGKIYPRSSISGKHLTLTNSVGIIDAGYRGEIRFRFRRTIADHVEPKLYAIGERVGQLIIESCLKVKLVECSDLSDSDRGTGGFGSTGS